jgi:hypothetical protein
MSAMQIIGGTFGFLIIVVTVWKLIRNGVARSNGETSRYEDAWNAPDSSHP